MAAAFWFELLSCVFVLFFLSKVAQVHLPWLLLCCLKKGRVRLEGARIGETEWNGEDGTLSADYCKWHRLMDRAINIMFPLISSLGERSILH